MGADDDFIFYFQRGSRAFSQGDFEEAREALERAFELRPDNGRAQNMLGLAYFKLGLLEAARLLYERLAREHPREPSLFVNLGLVLLRQGRLPEAESVLRTALVLAPQHKRANSYLGLVLHRRGDSEHAREHLVRGGATEMIARLDRRSLAAPRPSEILRAVADDGLESIDQDPGSLRPITAADDETAVRDEDAWQSRVGHGDDVDRLFSPRDDELRESTWPKESTGGISIRITESPMAPGARNDSGGTILAHAIRPSGAGWSTPPARLPLVEPLLELAHELTWPDGFAIGTEPSSTARVRLRGELMLRTTAIAFSSGSLELSAGPTPGLAKAIGDARIVLSFERFAILLRVEGRTSIRTASIAAVEPSVSFVRVDSSTAVAEVEGRGAVLLDGPGHPLAVTVSPRAPLWCDERMILAYSGELASSWTVIEGRPGLTLSGTGWAILDPQRARP